MSAKVCNRSVRSVQHAGVDMKQRVALKDDRCMSFEEIGAELGISYQRAAEICAKALRKFRAELLRRGYDGDSFLERICKRDKEDSEKSLQNISAPVSGKEGCARE